MLLDALQARSVFAHALRHHYAILAINADSHAAVTDCLEAARLCDAPVIIETSLWQLEGRAYGGGDAVLGLARYLAELAVLAESPRYANVPVIFHTDHIKGPKTLTILTAALQGIPLQLAGTRGFLRASTVSLDASAFSDEENIAMLCQLADIASAAGVPATFEMESEVDEGPTPLERTRKLVGAVEAKHPGTIWLWAPALGTKHGLTAGGYPEFRVDLIVENIRCLHDLTGRDIGLALHGSSGLDEASLAAAARAGVVKVNWSSESLLLRSTAAQRFYMEFAAQLEPTHPKWKATAMDNGLQQHVAAHYIPKVVQRMTLLGGRNHGSQIVATLRNQPSH
jgi:fructose/tagatose bisphosphate aldolase